MSRLPRASRFVLACLPFVSGCRQHVSREFPHLPIDGVRFVGEARVVTPGDSILDVRVRAVNTGSAVRTLEFDDCSMNVGVTSIGPAPEHQWELVTWASSHRPLLPCVGYQATRDLAPGDSVSPADYRRRVPIRAILGDSLPTGRYRITTRVAANGGFSENLVVGELELRAPGSRSTAADAENDSGSTPE